MNRLITLPLLSLSIALAACGGDGKVPVPTSTSPTPAPAPAPVPAPAPAPSASLPADRTCGLSNFQEEMLNRINQARASARMCGSTFYKAAAPLAWNAKLFDAAALHAADMAANNYFAHNSQNGTTFSQRITAAGYTWSAAGENIAAGQTTVEQAMNGWLQSPNHCANIMSASFTEVGVACAKNDASTYRNYWVMDLARPR